MMKTHSKRAIHLLLILPSLCFLLSDLTPSSANLPPSYRSTPFSDGEVLRYKAKWSLFRVGTVEISQQVLDEQTLPKYLVQLKAKSTKIQVQLYAHSPTSTSFRLEQDKERTTVYTYDSKNRLVLMEKKRGDALVRRGGLPHDDDYYDLLGVIMMMRCLSSSESRIVLPTVVDFGMKNTDLNFTDELKNIKVAAFDRPIQARRIEGNANWKGLADVSGPFKAWVSNDEAAVPLKIELKASIGSVTLELERFHRAGWKLGDGGGGSK